jgi:DNA polymerase III subunit epsilon
LIASGKSASMDSTLPMLPEKIAFVDIETTGARSSFDRIIEIGILRMEGDQIVRTYNQLINPQAYLSPDITRLTGITSNMLENAPTFRQCKDDILELLQDCVFVAHNVRFDYGFLRNELQRTGVTFSSKHFCTVRLSRLLFPHLTHHNLDSVMQYHNIACANRHRAFDDAKVLHSFYTKIQKELPAETLQAALSLALRKPSLPIKLKQEDLDALPEHPGATVYWEKH